MAEEHALLVLEDGTTLPGRVVMTFLRGAPTVLEGKLT